MNTPGWNSPGTARWQNHANDSGNEAKQHMTEDKKHQQLCVHENLGSGIKT